MKKGKRGFTLVEVAIFLAVTGVLFLGVTAGVQTSVYQQRRSDSVQNFIEFLRGVYSEVENVQNDAHKGNSEQAIYGRLVTFGESVNLTGNNIGSEDKNRIFVYTVVGSINSESGQASGKIQDALKDRKMDVRQISDESGTITAGYASEYIPKWGAVINPACSGANCSYEPLKGTLLIARHPNSGTIWTLYRPGTLEVNAAIAGNRSPFDEAVWSSFSYDNNVDFCVNPSGEEGATDRTDVRLIAGARNASGIEQVPDYEGLCGANW